MNKTINKVVIAIMALLIVAGLFLFINGNPEEVVIIDNDDNDYHTLEYNGETYYYNTDIISILLMGIDTNEGVYGQSDHMSLLIIDRRSKEIKLLAIPRETITEIEMYGDDGSYLGLSDNHLGLAYPNGYKAGKAGIVTMEATSKLLLNIPIIYYVATNMNVMPMLAEIVGDVDIELPDDSLAYRNPEWVKGYIFNVNKDTIEIYLRSRNIYDDFTNKNRMLRQNLYLNWFFDNINSINEEDESFLLAKLEEILENCETNLSWDEAETFYELAMDSMRSDPFAYSISGRYAIGQFYEDFYPNEEDLLSLIIKLFYVKEI
ncbi:MAG: LCP family protein [Erysipelotrichaceae bacterium]|nr:LCP family protein [Erysipelotrichaceae bacterium]